MDTTPEEKCTTLAFIPCYNSYKKNIQEYNDYNLKPTIIYCAWKIVCPVICAIYVIPFVIYLRRFYVAKYFRSFAATMNILVNEKKFWILVLAITELILVFFNNLIE